MSEDTRVSLAVLAGIGLIIGGWGGITSDAPALLLAFVAASAVTAVGLIANRLRLGSAFAIAIGALTALAATSVPIVASIGVEGLVRAPESLQTGITTIRTGLAPLPAQFEVASALVGIASMMALLALVFAVSMQRPAYVALPFLALYLVATVGSPESVPFDQVARFGFAVSIVLLAANPRPSGTPITWTTIWPGIAKAVVITTVALLMTWATGGFIPIAPPSTMGNSPIQMADPSLDLRRNLQQSAETPLLTYTTDQPTGAYLRLATLTRFDALGFGLDTLHVTGGNQLPSPPGLSKAGPTRRTQVQVGAFANEWLPAPYSPRGVSAAGAWGFANETLDIMAMGRNRTTATAGLTYEVTSIDVRPTQAQIAGSTSTTDLNSQAMTRVPAELSQRTQLLARQVTDAAPTAGAKALALQGYLQSGQFRYSTASAQGDSMQTLDDFLFVTRTGYCEQFAGSMVAMARSLGIPARLVVGFTPGTYVDGRWRVTSRNMHAWPELWLDGWGWVAFEPTPSSGAPTATPTPGSTPSSTTTAHSTEAAPAPGEPSAEDESSSPSPADPSKTPPGVADGTDPTPAFATSGILVALGSLALITMALVAPRLLRLRRRLARLGHQSDPRTAALSAWAELRDAAIDLRIGWPPGSPRFIAEDLTTNLPDAVASDLLELALAAERAMFDDPDAYRGPSEWAEPTREIVDALTSQTSPAVRLRAIWWPRSLWRAS